MRNNIKIFAVAALLGLLAIFGSTSTFAQINTVDVDLKNQCLTGNDDRIVLFTDGIPTGKTTPDVSNRLTSPKLQSISFTVYKEDDHTVDDDATAALNAYADIEKIANGECSLFSGATITKAGTGTKARYFIKHLNMTPKATNFSYEYYGRKITIQFVFTGNALSNTTVTDIVTYSMFVFGGGKVDNKTALTDDIIDGYYMGFLCENDPVYIKIGNSDNPYGSKYTAEYSWTVQEGAGAQYSYITPNPKEFSDDHFTVGKSKFIQFTPFMSLKEGSEYVCENMKFSDYYLFYYRSPLTADFYINGNKTSAAVVCNDDEVEVAFDFFQDGDFFAAADAALYLDEINGVPTGSTTPIDANNFYETSDEQKFQIGTLNTVGGKNTLYKYKLVVKDRTLDDDYYGEPIDYCESIMYFTVKVLEKDAKVELTSDGSHCENDDVVITMNSLTTAGIAADYTYQLRRKVKDADDATAANIPTSDGGNKFWFQVTDPTVAKGDYTYMMYIKNQGGCEYKAGEIDVHVAEAPIIAADNIVICKNDDAVIDLEISNTSSQPEGSKYTYIWTAGISDVDMDKEATFSKTVLPKPLTTKSYTVKAKNQLTSCVSNPKTILVNVNALPDIESISGPSEDCLNSEVTLTPVLVSSYTPEYPITYTWTRKDGATTVETKEGATYSYILDKEYDVTVSAKDGNGCSSEITQSKKVTINPLPDFAPSAEATCSGSDWTLEMNNGDSRVLTYSFTSTTPGAPSIASTSDNTFTVTSPSGITVKTTYSYTVKAKDEKDCEDEKELLLTVNPLPEITSLKASKTDQCLGTPVTLTVKANSKVSPKTLTYEWYDGSDKLSGTAATIEVNPSTPGLHTFSVVVKDANGCTISKTVDVNFYEITTVEVFTDDDEICVGESTLLKAKLGTGANAADYSFKWSHGAVTQDVTVSPAVTTPYSVVIKQTVTGCTVSSAERDIYVNQLPEFTIKTVPAEVCEGEVTEVIMTMLPKAGTPVPSDYVWVSGGSASDFVATGTPNEYKASMAWSTSTTYTYNAVTDKTCKSKDPASVTIEVNPLPATPTATASPAQICKGDDTKVTLSISAPDDALDYFWFSDAACTVPLNSGKAATSFMLPTSLTSALDANTTFYVKAKNKTKKCECAEVGKVTLVVNAIPAAVLSVDNAEFCVGTMSANIEASIALAGTYTYAWTSDKGDFTSTSANIIVSPSETTTYTVVATNTNTNCKTEPAYQKITINQLPKFIISFDPTEVCEGVPTTVNMKMTPTLDLPEPDSYTCTSGNGSDFTQNSLGDYTATSKTWYSNTDYEFTAMSASGCVSLPVRATLKVNPKPDAPDFVISPAQICVGDATTVVKLSVTPVAGMKYVWYQGSTKLGEGETYTITENPAVSTEYSVMAVNGCESDLTKHTLVVNTLPTVTITGNASPCEGESITLTATPVAGSGGTFAADSYEWYADGVKIPGEVSSTLTVTPDADITYSVKVKESTDCVATGDFNVVIEKRPAFTVEFDKAFVCEGLSTTVNITLTPKADSPVITSYSLASGPDDFSEVSLGKYKATKSWSSPTEYCFNAVGGNGCSTTSSVCGTLDVSAKPETPIISFDRPTVCKGEIDPVTVTIENYKSGLIYTVTDGTNDIVVNHTSKTFQITSVPTVETTYYITAESGFECNSDKGSNTLKIAELPSVTITGDAAICEGSSVTLTANVTRGAGASSSLSYKWALSTDPTNVISTDASPEFTPTADTEYIVTVFESDAATCSASNTHSVDVQKLPVITAKTDKDQICEGYNTTVTLTAVPDAESVAIDSYEWFDASNASVGTGVSLPLTESSWVAGTYNYTVKATSAESKACVSAAAPVSFTVNPQPVKPVVSLDKLTICQLASGTQAVVATVTNVQSGYTYIWYNSADEEQGSGNTITLKVDDTAAGVQHYYVVAIDKNFTTDCISEKTDVDVEVVALPAAPVVAPVATEYCLNDASHATVLTLDENSALTYEWFQYVDGVSDISVSTASSFTTPDHLDATTSYYVVATNTNKCKSEKSALSQITIVNNPVLSTVDPASIMVCPGLPSTRAITVTSANGEDLIFEWYIDGIAVDPSTVVSAATESTYTFASMAQTGTFNVNVKAWINNSGVKGCQADDLNFVLEIKDFENLNFTVNGVDYTEGITFNICQGADAKFVFSNLNGVSYKILDKNNVEVLNSSEATNSFVVADDDEYTLIKYSGDCTSPIEQHFKIAARKQVLFDLNVPTDACVASDILLEAVNFDFQGNDDTKVSYQWYLDDVAITGANGQAYAITGVTDAVAGTYKLVATSDYDCATTHTAAVAVHDLPIIDWVADKTADILCLDGEERLFTIESTNGHTITDALWDIATLDFGVVDTDPQISAKAVSPAQADGDIVTINVYVVDENSCQTSLSKDVKVVAIPAVTSVTDQNGNADAFHLCEGNDLILTVNSTPASGDFTYVYYKEGAVIDAWTTNSASKTLSAVSADLAGNYTVAIYDNVSKCTSAEYAFTIDFPLPTADMTISPVSKLVIEGSPVEVTVTSGYTDYKFFLNGVEQTTGIVDNVFTYNAAETATVSAEVYNEYDCFITLEDVVTVLEGIADRKVEITADTQNDDKTEAMYCSTNRTVGATISVVEPQIGITYVLSCIETGAQIGEPIEALPDVDVKWTAIKTVDETSALQIKTDNTFKVTAYHAALPDETTEMAQHVAVSEIYGGISETVSPAGEGLDCTGETFKITNALVDYEYSLYLNGSAYGSSVIATSDNVELPGIIAFTGKYEVRRVYPAFPVCGQQVVSTYEIPEVEATKVTIFADDRLTIADKLVGFYCKSDDKMGVNITIENSGKDQEYYVYYQTTIDQVPEKVSAPIIGTGDDLMIGNTADMKGDGFYSLGYEIHGCIQLVSENILEVAGYTAPDKADFTVTTPEYFCEGNKAEIEISGVLEDYYNYRLIRTSPTYTISDVVLTGTTPGSFEVEMGGTYQIEVVNKILEQMNLTCANTLLDPVVVKRLDIPAPISAGFDKTDFCLDNIGEAYAILTLANLAPDVYYSLYDEANFVVADKLGNDIVDINDALGNGVKKFELALVEGEHTYTVRAYRRVDGVIVCTETNVATVSVKVRPRPGVDAEVVSTNTTPAQKGTDPCYGVDIEIANSRADMVYTLHSAVDDAIFMDGGYGSEAPKSSVQGNGDVVKFINIAVNGDFYVTVNYVDGPVDCEDKVGDVNINEDFLEKVTPSLTVPETCQGSDATMVMLDKWQDPSIAFYELRDAHNNVVATSDDAVKILGGTLTFNREFRSSNVFTVVAYKMMDLNSDGDLEPGCPVVMGSVNFIVHPLPKSFELSGRNIYCGDKSDIQLILPESEPDVEYTLYVKDTYTKEWTEYFDEDGNKVSVMGRDDLGEVYFPRTSSTDQRFLDQNLYTVIAYNTVTHCTSAMKNEVKVLKRDDLNSDPILPKHEYKSCQGETEKVVLAAAKTQADVTYYFYHSADASELALLEAGVTPAMLAELSENQDKADDLVIRKYTGSDITFAPSTIGDYIIMASYDEYACPTFIDKFTYSIYNVDKYQLDAIAHCGGRVEYVLNGSQTGVVYTPVVNGVERPADAFLGDNDPKSFELEIADVTPETVVTVKALLGTCEIEMGGVVYPYTKTIPTVNFIDVTFSDRMCSQGVYTFKSSENKNKVMDGKFQPNMTYYFMINGEDPKAGDAPIVMRKADADGNIDVRIPAGSYKVWATYEDEFDCFKEMDGTFVIKQDIIDNYILKADNECGNGEYIITLENPYGTYEYSLNAAEGTTITPITGKYSWSVSGTGKTKFDLVVVDEGCPADASIYVDFDELKSPEGTIDILLNGNELEEGETPAFCNETAVRLLASIKNLPQVDNYTFKFFERQTKLVPKPTEPEVPTDPAEDPETPADPATPEESETPVSPEVPESDMIEVTEYVAVSGEDIDSETSATKADLSNFKAGKYQVRLTAKNGDCVYNEVAVLDFEITEVPVVNVDTTLATICGDVETTLYKSDVFNQGYTYYFTKDGDTTPYKSAVADENNTISIELPEGTYTVSADSKFDCLTPMDGAIVVKHDYFNAYVLTSEMSACDGKATITLQNPDDAAKKYTYNITASADDATAVRNADTFVWDVTGKGKVTYTLTVATENGCEKQTSVVVDFDAYIAPEGSIAILLNGEELPAGADAAFCNELPVRFIASVKNMPVINSYTFSFAKYVTKVVDGVEQVGVVALGNEFDITSATSAVPADFTKFEAGDYQVQLNVKNDDCEYKGIATYDFTLSEVPVVDVTMTLDMICDQEPTAHYESDIYKSGYTYYFTKEGEASVFATQTVGENGTIVLELPEGTYTVTADSKYDCLTPMTGAIVVARDAFPEYAVPSYDCNNNGQAIITLANASSDHIYSITTPEGANAPVAVGDKVNAWSVDGSGIVTYTLNITSNASSCEKNIPFNVDFNANPSPTGSFEFYIEGQKFDRSEGVVPEICSSSNVTMVADVKGMTTISDYTYDFYKLVEKKNEDGKVELVADTVKFAYSTVQSNILVQSFESFDQSQLYRVLMSVRNGKCGPYTLDSLDFKIKGSVALANRFMPDDVHIRNVDTLNCQVSGHVLEMHGEYCEGDSAVNLYFSDAQPGYIYRLYQRTTEQIDSVTTRESVELLDIQEIPDYSKLIPGYTARPVDKLWFTGWGANGVAKPYGATGSVEGTRYFVAVEETDGCVITTPDVIIYENPLPIDTVKSSPTYNEVYYALLDENGTPNFDVKSTDYGIVDAGFVILSNPQPGIFYELRHVDSPLGPDYLVSHVVCDSTTTARGWVSFGKVESSEEAIANGWGAGIYEVIAINPTTGCDVSVGSVEFIDEELVAYNVYLFMNKKQNTVSQILYPSEEKFGNHRYIDWSRKVDVVWSPALVTDTITGEQYINSKAEDYEPRSGYSIFEKKANIHFQMVQAMKDTVTYHDVDLNEFEYAAAVAKDPDHTFKQLKTRLEKYYLYNVWTDTITGEILKDSVSTGDILITYENGREKSRQYINTADDNTKPTNDLGAIIETYKYWQTVYDTIQVIDYSKKYGDYGFDPDYDALNTPELVDDSKSGLFRYTKMPSFFGKVELTYRIYNDLLPKVRFSNNAQIVILCGNNLMPDGNSVFLVPNAFSPNDDGLNDKFEIVLPHNYENSQVILEVFNRWGTRVYKSSGIRYGIDCPFWDGTSTTSNMVTVGEKLPSGTYYYVLTIKVNNPSTGTTEDLDLKGFVELRR